MTLARLDLGLGAALVAVATALRWWVVVELWGTPFANDRDWSVDAAYYWVRAGVLATGDLVDAGPSFMAPAYCAVLALLTALGGSAPTLQLAQATVDGLTCGALFVIGHQLGGRWVGMIAGGLWALYGLALFYVTATLPTTAIVAGQVWAVALLVAPLPPARSGVAAGLCVGFAAACKASSLALVPVLAAWAAWRGGGRRAVLGLGFGVALALAPFVARNAASGAPGVLLTTNAGLNLLIGNGRGATGTYRHVAVHENANMLNQARGTTELWRAVHTDRRMAGQALRWMRSHPADTVALWGRKVGMLWSAEEPGPNHAPEIRRWTTLTALPLPTFGLVGALGLAGLLAGARTWWHTREGPLVLGWIAANTVAFVLVFVLARYRMPLAATLTLPAAWFLVEAVRRGRERPIPFVAALLVGAVVVNGPRWAPEATVGAGPRIHLHLARWYADHGEQAKAREHATQVLEQTAGQSQMKSELRGEAKRILRRVAP